MAKKNIRKEIKHQLIRARGNAENTTQALAIVNNTYQKLRPDLCVKTRLMLEVSQLLLENINCFIETQP